MTKQRRSGSELSLSLSIDSVTLSCCESRGMTFCILSGHTFTTVGPCSPEKGAPEGCDRHLDGQGVHSARCGLTLLLHTLPFMFRCKHEKPYSKVLC